MSTNIHSTAIVAKNVQLGTNVSVGPYTIIEDDVVIGDNTEIKNNCVIGKNTKIGKNNQIFSSVILGTDPQDLKYKGEKTYTIIGNENIFREFVTVNNGTGENGVTIIGDKNAFLAYTHVAHDCKLGNNIVMSNIVQLGGHTVIEDGVVLGGLVGVHQFSKIGKYAMIAANAIIVKDVTPFSLIDRTPAYHGINRIGLKRRGFTDDVMNEISNFYTIVLKSGMNNTAGIKKYIEEKNGDILPEIQYCIDFIQASERGILR